LSLLKGLNNKRERSLSKIERLRNQVKDLTEENETWQKVEERSVEKNNTLKRKASKIHLELQQAYQVIASLNSKIKMQKNPDNSERKERTVDFDLSFSKTLPAK